MRLPEQVEQRQVGGRQRQAPTARCRQGSWARPFARSGLAQSRDLGHVRGHAGAWTNGSLEPPANLRADQTRKFREDPSRTRHRRDRKSSRNLSKLGRNHPVVRALPSPVIVNAALNREPGQQDRRAARQNITGENARAARLRETDGPQRPPMPREISQLCGCAWGAPSWGRLRRSAMNWSNSARSLAKRSRSRNSLNSRCSSSSRRSVSVR